MYVYWLEKMVRAIKSKLLLFLVTLKFLQSKNTTTIRYLLYKRVASYTCEIIITAVLFYESNAWPVWNISLNLLIHGIRSLPQENEYFDRNRIKELIF